jgi:TPR repeat protein
MMISDRIKTKANRKGRVAVRHIGILVLGLMISAILVPNPAMAVHVEEPSDLFWNLIEEARWGESEAQYTVAMMYAAGEGVEMDQVEAAKWFEKAAHEGHPHAMFKIAERYEKGNGVAKDAETAMLWYRKAAETGYKQGEDKAYFDQVRQLQVEAMKETIKQEQLEEERKYQDQVRKEQNRLLERMNKERYRYDPYYNRRRSRNR